MRHPSVNTTAIRKRGQAEEYRALRTLHLQAKMLAAQSQRQNQAENSNDAFPFNGGRDRTRTCDLLRVKNSGSFYPFYLLLWLSTIWGVCFRSADIS
jgi:hypothetical protein